ncbi:hypothetical protein C8R45DRAFT_800584, partial [Mycena sanguinolenta]
PLLPPMGTNHDTLHPQWYVRATMYLVAFLHTQHHVTFRACAQILTALDSIFSALVSKLSGRMRMPTTLKTVFSRLGIEDRFVVYPVCYVCHRIFDSDTSPTIFCPDCDVEIFRPAPRHLFHRMGLDESVPGDETDNVTVHREPYLIAPIQLLSQALEDIFARPGMVFTVNAWKARVQVAGELRSMQDAKVWKEIKGHDGQPFFFGASSKHEVRLGVTFSLDCNGLHADLKTSFRAENLILCGMLPGPTEPSANSLQNYLKPIVDDLLVLYNEGIIIKTTEHPTGK